MNEENQESKLHIDSDWKNEARREKERLAEEARAKQAEAGPNGEGDQEGQMRLPPSDFRGLISQLVSQAMLYMGMIPDPNSGQRVWVPELAKHTIDILGVLEEKTKGNLTDEEDEMLSGAANELRMAFVQVQKQAEQQMAQQAMQQGGGKPEAKGGSGGIIMP